MGIGIYLLQAMAFLILTTLMLVTKRVSPTGSLTVVVIGFIGMIGKLYDQHREQRGGTAGSGS